MANILSTANSALAAAQAGLATTAHNIANAKTPGYNRQVVLQAAIGGQDEGGGFIGKGTEVVSVRRVYNEFLAAQVRTVETSKGQFESHYMQANRINSMMSDPTSGLSPVLQEFFGYVSELAANPGTGEAMLSGAQSLAGRFQSMDGQLRDLRASVNTEISNSITAINSYAQQIADLNDAIASAKSGSGQLPNDLLDQRDYLVSELSKLTKVSVSKDGNNYGIFIGNGQPMVVGTTVTKLEAITSSTDLSEITIGMATGSGTIRLSESNLQGGTLGGLIDFRSTTLTNAQNALGRIALGLATTFNDQHKLGKDATGAMGGNFFSMASPVVNANTLNTGDAVLSAAVTDVDALTASDYKVVFDGTNYNVTRLSDKTLVSSTPGFPVEVDGVSISLDSGAMAAGDYFIVKPTINAAAGFSVLVEDPNNIAIAAPVKGSWPTSNAGSGVIPEGSISVDKNFLPAMVPQDMYYDAATNTLNGSPGATNFAFDVKVTTVDGVSNVYSAGTPVPYTAGATITFGASLAGPDVGGISFKISGTPADGDRFTIENNTTPKGDNSNIGLLAGLATVDTMINGTANYQDALAQMVASVGNKTHELKVGMEAQTSLVGQLRQAQDADSGVNLDEEGANLLQYQQAYIAAGRVMQAVKEMFDALVAIGQH